MIGDLKVYYKNMKNPPKSKNFETVKKYVNDPLLSAKLGFMITICMELETFLVKCQSNKPMLPFLYNYVYKIMKYLYGCIIKSEIMADIKNTSDLLRID